MFNRQLTGINGEPIPNAVLMALYMVFNGEYSKINLYSFKNYCTFATEKD